MMKSNLSLQGGFISRRLLIWLIIIFIVLAALVAVCFYYPRILPIRKVVIHGNLNSVQQNRAQAFIKPFLSSGFLGIKVGAIQKKLEKISGVSKVEVRRIWPNKLIISISNQRPIAVWNQDQLITKYGEIVLGNEGVNFKVLPRFYGPDNSQIQVLDYYQQMSLILSPLNLMITEISLSSSQLWQIKLSNRMQIKLGRQFVLDRLSRFVTFYPKLLLKSGGFPKIVDLRYAHGMAVSW